VNKPGTDQLIGSTRGRPLIRSSVPETVQFLCIPEAECGFEGPVPAENSEGWGARSRRPVLQRRCVVKPSRTQSRHRAAVEKA
jgi:hypothetical protein